VATETSIRIREAALIAFAARGYDATSLDQVARDLEMTKQAILYWYPSKEALLEAVIDAAAEQLQAALLTSLAGAEEGFARVERVVRTVFRLGARRPELLGMLRECARLGPPASTRLAAALSPSIEAAASYLQGEMDAGRFRRSDPHFLLLALYSVVIGMVTEVDVLAAFGVENTARSLVARRRDVLALLRSALVLEQS